MKVGFKSFKKIFRYFMLHASNMPMPGHWRWRLVKLGGVNINVPKNKSERFVFIGDDVTWDTAYPEQINIGNHVHITTGCVLLTHYITFNEKGLKWEKGYINIEDDVFIGAKTIITKPVTIGHHSVVAAGSVVTHDIPPCEIWGGVPARFIKKLERIW